jgi:hypothetical protein
MDPNKSFTLEKCEIGLFNKTAHDLFLNFELIKDAAEHFERD